MSGHSRQSLEARMQFVDAERLERLREFDGSTLANAIETFDVRLRNEGFADGTFAAAKKGAIALVPPNAAKAASSWSWSMETACLWQST